MATVQYLDIAGLKIYDGLIKGVISAGDAKSIKSVAIEGTTLKFYKAEVVSADTVADFTIELPQQDLSNLLEKIASGTQGNVVTIGADGIVVDSGIAATDIATKEEVKAVADDLGEKASLKTTEKSTIVGAVNEVKDAVDSAKTAGVVSVSTTVTTEGMAKTYTFTQNSQTIATIDIPKDMVVSAGTVETYTQETLPSGEGAPTKPGTYIVLTIANKAASKLYIPAEKLVDVYTAAQGAAQVQLAVNGNEISATIVAGSIGTTELTDLAVTTAKIADANVTEAKLAADAVVTAKIKDANVTEAKLAADAVVTAKIKDANVTTAKIADENVTLAKLAADVKTSLGLADSAVQEADITELRSTAASALQPEDVAVISSAEINKLFEA